MISTIPSDGAPRVQTTVPRISHSPASANACSVANAPTSSKSVYMSVSKIIFVGAPNAPIANPATTATIHFFIMFPLSWLNKPTFNTSRPYWIRTNVPLLISFTPAVSRTTV